MYHFYNNGINDVTAAFIALVVWNDKNGVIPSIQAIGYVSRSCLQQQLSATRSKLLMYHIYMKQFTHSKL